jgi:hypothetical protein
MNVTPAEIESIVRRVLGTLIASSDSALRAEHAAQDAAPLNIRTIADPVVSVGLLRGQLDGIQQLAVRSNAVVTPAVRDLCRERNIAIVRSAAASTATNSVAVGTSSPAGKQEGASRPQRLLITGNVAWMDSVAKQLCPRQARVASKAVDDASAIRAISDGLRAGHQAAIAIVQAPHAACWQAARDDKLRPSVVSQWSDLASVLFEVPVNVLIVSAKTWNIPSACNLARRMFDHLQRNS